MKNWLILKDSNAGENWRLEEKGTTKDEMVGWHQWLNGHEFEQALRVDDGQGILACCSPWGREESDMTERLHFHFSLSFIGERNGNPLQCSCLENPKDGRAWWAAIYGVAQSWTRLKRLSSSITYFNLFSNQEVSLYQEKLNLSFFSGQTRLCRNIQGDRENSS